MRAPAFIRLLTQRIDVVMVPNLHHESEPDAFGHQHSHKAYGVYEEATQTISMDSDLGFERSRESFLHENLHAIGAAININSYLADPAAEEALITALAPVMLAWLRDNPDAVAFVMEVQP